MFEVKVLFFVGALVIDHGDITIMLQEDSTNVRFKVVKLKTG